MLKKSTITSQTAETHGACGKPFRPSLTTSPRHRPVMMTHPSLMPTPPNDQVLCLSPADVKKTLSRINPRKAAGPDNIPGRVLKDCAAQLTDVLTDIFNTSPSQAVVPTCLKSTTIIPVPKKSPVSCLNDYRPIALTPIMMKCFERLVMHKIKTSLPNTLDPLQFAYRPNRSTDNAISTTLHLALTHLENKDSYVRMLFIDFSSAFNTIIPQQLINKLNLLGLNNSLCNWILDFLTGRPQSVRASHNTSSTTTLSTGAPQGCVLSPLLFTLLTHDCTAKFSSNHIIKFADDTTAVGLISNNDETQYREEVAQLAEWCGTNNLSLNVGKTKEVVLDFRRNSVDHPPLTIDSSTVERVSSTKFLGVHITEDLTWTTNTMSLSKKGQQRLHFLRRLKRASLPPPISFYQLFGLSFWRHPFTTEHKLLRHWCSDTFLQIWWRNKLTLILDDLRVNTFSAVVHFWVSYSFNTLLEAFICYAL